MKATQKTKSTVDHQIYFNKTDRQRKWGQTEADSRKWVEI